MRWLYFAPSMGWAAELDVSAEVEDLGLAPFKGGPYSRNIWDLQWFEGRLYLGSGNSSNEVPEQNAGPAPIVSYDPATRQFVREIELPEEQVDVFRVIDGKLWTAGHDPREGWELGNCYGPTASGRSCGRFRAASTPMTWLAPAACWWPPWGPMVSATWPCRAMPVRRGLWWTHAGLDRRYHLAVFGDRLYAFGDLLTARLPRRQARLERDWRFPLEFDGEKWELRTDLDAAALLPGLPAHRGGAKLCRHAVLGQTLLYIAGDIWNDHQTQPRGLFAAASLKRGDVRIAPVALGADATPWDVVVQGDRAYVVTSTPTDERRAFVIRVWESADAKTWRPILRFTQPTFAREIVAGHAYFGLGTDVESDPANGRIFLTLVTLLAIDPSRELHLICDNYATHKHPAVNRWLMKHPRFHVHFTPTSSSWLNLVERWFRDLTDKRIRRGVFRSVRELVAAIDGYIEHHNNRTTHGPRWTAQADAIIEKYCRAKAALNKIPSG